MTQLRPGMACRVKELAASPELAHRLRELGFCEEQPIRVLSQSANLICQVCNVRLGISAELAASILVEPLGGRPVRG